MLRVFTQPRPIRALRKAELNRADWSIHKASGGENETWREKLRPWPSIDGGGRNLGIESPCERISEPVENEVEER